MPPPAAAAVAAEDVAPAANPPPSLGRLIWRNLKREWAIGGTWSRWLVVICFAGACMSMVLSVYDVIDKAYRKAEIDGRTIAWVAVSGVLYAVLLYIVTFVLRRSLFFWQLPVRSRNAWVEMHSFARAGDNA